MKIIVTKEQHKIIKEALGVPDSILDAAEELYDMFADNLKSITDKESSYEFRDDIDVVLGDKKKITIDEYTLEVEIEEVDDFHERVTPDRNVTISCVDIICESIYNNLCSLLSDLIDCVAALTVLVMIFEIDDKIVGA